MAINLNLVSIVFGFCILTFLIPFVQSQNVQAGCIRFNLPHQFEKNFPCSWNEPIVSLVLTDPHYASVFKCRNVPKNAVISYTVTPMNSNNQVPFSISVWAKGSSASNIQIDQDLFNNFVKWGKLPLNERQYEQPQCLNYPDCLVSSHQIHTVSNFRLGTPVGIFQTTTYNTFISITNYTPYIPYRVFLSRALYY